MGYRKRTINRLLGRDMTEKEAIEKLVKMWEEVAKAIETLDKRVSALEDTVYNDIEFTPDFYTQEAN